MTRQQTQTSPTRRRAETIQGIEDGQTDRAKCNDSADLTAYQRLAFDAQTDDPRRAHYFIGYLHGLTGGK